MGLYITVNDVKGKAIDEKVNRAGWEDTDIEKKIEEAESYINSRLVRLGYTINQLKTAPLVKVLCINYARYCILRDIFTNLSRNVSTGTEYEKWKEEVEDILEKLEKNEVRLVDTEGNILNPIKGDTRYEIEMTTKNVKRAITMAPSYTWRIDESYYDEDVVGEK